MKRAGALLAIALLAAGVPRAFAQPERLVVVADSSSKLYDETVDAMRRSGVVIERIAESDPALSSRLRADDRSQALWLAMGPRSARRLSLQDGLHRAALFVHRSEVPAGLSAVAVDVRVETRIGWAKAAFPGRRRLLVLHSPGSPVDVAALEKACAAADVELIAIPVRSPGEALPALTEALRLKARASILWLLPDPAVITPDTIAPLIQAAHAVRVPAVGFLGLFLRSGAIAAIATDYGAMAQQALRLARSSTATAARIETPERARLLIDRRLAERIGIGIGAGEGIEVLP